VGGKSHGREKEGDRTFEPPLLFALLTRSPSEPTAKKRKGPCAWFFSRKRGEERLCSLHGKRLDPGGERMRSFKSEREGEGGSSKKHFETSRGEAAFLRQSSGPPPSKKEKAG